jgi:tRNA dimethylallyltransferase
MKTNYLISVVGPTAICKTALGIQLAKHFNTEIISADSRQFFKEMCIGTAVPSQVELESAPHHFIQHISVDTPYSVGDFEKDTLQLLDHLFIKSNVVIMVGGSGLYVNAVTNGLDKFPEIDANVRVQLKQQLEVEGLAALQEQLKTLDLKTYNTIALDNPQRIIRALEVCIGSGLPYSSYLNNQKDKRSFKTITIGLTAEREIIYDRINRRVDIMLEQGLLDEVQSLLPKQHLNALKTVGYRELFNYLNGEWSLDFAVSEIKKNTRRFAKRQGTWFRKNEDILWFDYKSDTIIDSLNEKISL